ncbi:hypothetical protein RhiTH_008977 [Rhizoctonia solani]
MAPAAGGVQAASASIDPSVLFKGRWWEHSHILTLNLLLVVPLATSYANGFDGSMMNGLQSVQQWKDYFGNPSAKDLGLFNAIQSIGIPSNWSWRIPSALQGLSSVIQLALIWFLPESPRWLISKGRDDEARQVLVKWHAGGREEDPLVAMEYTQIKEALGLESQNANASWLDLFRTPGNRRRIRIIFFSALTACSAVFATTSNAHAGRGVLAFVFIFNGFYAIAYTPLIVSYTVEILPFFLRAKGLAFMNLSVMGAIIFNQYTNPIALDALQWKYYLVYSCWLVFELAYMYMFAVETKGRSLEETAALFDGDEAVYELKDRMKADIVESGHRQEEKGPVNESQVELLSRPSRAA